MLRVCTYMLCMVFCMCAYVYVCALCRVSALCMAVFRCVCYAWHVCVCPCACEAGHVHVYAMQGICYSFTKCGVVGVRAFACVPASRGAGVCVHDAFPCAHTCVLARRAAWWCTYGWAHVPARLLGRVIITVSKKTIPQPSPALPRALPGPRTQPGRDEASSSGVARLCPSLLLGCVAGCCPEA